MAFINFQPSDYFNTKLYTGTGSTQSVTGVGFQPDFVWIKNRSTTFNHQINDAVRGVNKQIAPNLTNAQETNTGELTAFGSDGFTVGSGGTLNGNGNNIVSWNWKANGAGVSNTDGSITSTVSASSTSGFSIVTYTGNGSSGATVGHGLGSAPKMIILKELNNATDWFVYHNGIGATKYLSLNDTDAAVTTAAAWNDTAPSSSVFTLGNGTDLNGSSDNYIAYCFADVQGFSKVGGSYVGNASASDNAFVYCGFKPAFLITKCTSIAGDRWTLYDNKRDPYNYVYRRLFPDGNIAESLNTDADIDFLSNGFKIRTDAGTSGAAQTYIYMAFAEEPLVSSNGVPNTAR